MDGSATTTFGLVDWGNLLEYERVVHPLLSVPCMQALATTPRAPDLVILINTPQLLANLPGWGCGRLSWLLALVCSSIGCCLA
jgi:hypothetical protein